MGHLSGFPKDSRRFYLPVPRQCKGAKTPGENRQIIRISGKGKQKAVKATNNGREAAEALEKHVCDL